MRIKHAVTRLPGFLPRETELRVIERALEGEPSFTVLFGASAVGKVCFLSNLFVFIRKTSSRFIAAHIDYSSP